jgi:hypothetical protein
LALVRRVVGRPIPASEFAEAEALSEVLEANLKELATKGDIAAIQKDLLNFE